jgi:hypothetical protein
MLSEDPTLPFGTLDNAALNSFGYMLGGFDVDFGGTISPFLMSVIFVIFETIVTILLLNLLIALMGDTYQSVSQNGLAQWRFEQCTVVFDQGFQLEQSKKQDDDVFPKTIHLLKRVSDMEEIITDDKNEYENIIKKLRNEINLLKNKTKSIDLKLDNILDHISNTSIQYSNNLLASSTSQLHNGSSDGNSQINIDVSGIPPPQAARSVLGAVNDYENENSDVDESGSEDDDNLVFFGDDDE